MGVDHINEVVGITGWESTLYNLPNEMLNFRYTLWLEVKVLSSSLKTVVFSSLAEFRGLPSIPLKKKKKSWTPGNSGQLLVPENLSIFKDYSVVYSISPLFVIF